MLRSTMLLCVLIGAGWLGAWTPAAHATDGTVLINQATAAAGLPGCGSTGFPIVICQSGSYRLSGNLEVADPRDAIHITASDVTLDLNGFSIVYSSFPGAEFGINAAADHVTVSNGIIDGFVFGVRLTGVGETIQSVKAVRSAITGLIMVGSGMIRDSQTEENDVGISIGSGTVAVVQNYLANNASVGLEVTNSATVSYSLNNFLKNGSDLYVAGAAAVSGGNNSCSTGPC